VKVNFNDSSLKARLYPFAQTRDAIDIRVGIFTVREKWMRLKMEPPAGALILSGVIDAAETKQINTAFDIVRLNDWALRQDFVLITKGRQSQTISSTNSIISAENIFIEQGAKMEYCIINASAGPVYIGRNAEIMEGSMIRGPFAVCEGGIIKMGAKIYGATTIGPYSVAGGEIKNSVIFGNSNKAHDGYLGDSVLGEWCNLGAGTTNSNVKNTASEVRIWNNDTKNYEGVGMKAGLLMGDYSRAAINTSFNTGTVVGICCNIFGAEFPPKYVPDFTWGIERYDLGKAIKDITNWKKLKGEDITEQEKEILSTLYNQ
jgi:UDP-N-acetylglucosamine diphosphorylase/glucosamine-1-phosphate N-acetyltransferase